MAHTELSDLRLNVNPEAWPIKAKDFNGRTVEGRLHSATLTTPNGICLNLAYRQDAHGGGGELQCADVFAGSPELEGIKGRLRIGVRPTEDGKAFAQMRVAVIPQRGERAAARAVALAEMDTRCGGDVVGFLTDKGVLRVGTRETLFSETNRNRGELAAEVSGIDAIEPLLWVFAVTRVLPLLRQIEDGF